MEGKLVYYLNFTKASIFTVLRSKSDFFTNSSRSLRCHMALMALDTLSQPLFLSYFLLLKLLLTSVYSTCPQCHSQSFQLDKNVFQTCRDELEIIVTGQAPPVRLIDVMSS